MRSARDTVKPTAQVGGPPITKKKPQVRKKPPATKIENPNDPRNPPPHGTTQRYRRHKCRCSKCTTAQREALRLHRTGDIDAGWSGRKHGTRSCYVGGCREPECIRANRVYQNDYMRKYRAGKAGNRAS